VEGPGPRSADCAPGPP